MITYKEYRNFLKVANKLSFNEYEHLMDKWEDSLRESCSDDNKWEQVLTWMREFQTRYMKSVIADYKKKIKTKVQEIAYDFIEGILSADEGCLKTYTISKGLAEQAKEEIYDNFGDFLLEGIELYEEDDEWVLDGIAGGNYCPCWNGWWDEMTWGEC